jgi:outer membrane protein assembly factor BamE (lipoprotein component of BamABCDE complex)
LPNRNIFTTYLRFLLFCLTLLLIGCGSEANELEQASRSYKTQQDYASLERIHMHLRTGMARTEVEELLGEPDYSPVEGQYYYSSNRQETAGSGKKQVKQIDMPVGLVVEYRDEQGKLTGQVQKFWLGNIGE